MGHELRHPARQLVKWEVFEISPIQVGQCGFAVLKVGLVVEQKLMSDMRVIRARRVVIVLN